MANPIAACHAEHAYFKQLLRLLHKQVDVFHTGKRPNYELMLDIISALKDYSDQFHHPREDVAFARLAKHRPDIGLVLARLSQEPRQSSDCAGGDDKRQDPTWSGLAVCLRTPEGGMEENFFAVRLPWRCAGHPCAEWRLPFPT